MRAIAIPQDIRQHNQSVEVLKRNLNIIRQHVKTLYSESPDVSIIIPAYNEESSILKTLSSLSVSSTKKTVEIIVVNNNSTDTTAELAIDAGVTCITETRQGITAARNSGLRVAKGKFILNADADTIYPASWIDNMIAPLHNDDTALVYGTFSFIPGTGNSRILFAGYEYMADLSKWLNKKFRDEAMNVYGFNSAFRKSEGLAVDGFNHPPGTNEDGWLAVKLRDILQKKLYQVKGNRAHVWTSDRRIQMDGGMFKALVKRFRKKV